MSLYVYDDAMEPHPTHVGDVVRVRLPYSEVCMHMRIAGRVFDVRVFLHMAQPLRDDGTPYCPAITHGEAGIFGRPDGV